MGHVGAIVWVHRHTRLHDADFVKEFRKVEPYLRLNPAEAVNERRVKAEQE